MTSKNNIVYERSSLVENKNFKVNETYKRNSHFFKNSMFKNFFSLNKFCHKYSFKIDFVKTLPSSFPSRIVPHKVE